MSAESVTRTSLYIHARTEKVDRLTAAAGRYDGHTLYLDREIKWHCKYACQNGIHVSPTCMIDGLVQPDMSSGDAAADWASRLLKHGTQPE